MITRNDCMLLLANLPADDKSDEMLSLCCKSHQPNIDVMQYIHSRQPLDIIAFYNKIRKSYNNKKSTLYINIMKEIDNVDDVMVTLASLLTQIMLFAKTVDDKQMFLQHSRASDIVKCLSVYYKSYNPEYAIKLIQIFKADIKVLEEIDNEN